MKIALLGAGQMGRAVLFDLLRNPAVAQIRLFDNHVTRLNEIRERFSDPRLHLYRVDAKDQPAMQTLLRGSEVIISCLPYTLNPSMARMAVELGVPFCDLGGSDVAAAQELALHEEAQTAGVWVLPNCGLAPGLTNILVMHGVEQFDEVDAIAIRVGSLPLTLRPPFYFQLTFSAEGLLDEYTRPVEIIRNGQLLAVEPLNELEYLEFPEPFGRLEAFLTAGSLSTLPRLLLGRVRQLDYKTLRYPGHRDMMRMLFALGLAESRLIDVRSTLTYRDLLLRRLRKALAFRDPDAVLVYIHISGRRGGQIQSLYYTLVDRYDEAHGLSAMMRATAFPISVIGQMLAMGQIPGSGAAAPEQVVPKTAFLEAMRERGLQIETRWETVAALPGD
ncbi:MAG: saccharopine dehydrogenase NADP-binding domain-containing protein [Bacteroidetes bacterium]|nr:saccharopine dehydrogenase NADP-binding domain-containing protein [Rhodothermia bacterium]MCS7154874.1 saccharopine dehydrogenase NADP-binding domain-containing protein [Bacteroidota bacterium]MCX7906968.1 saccharopine dehydrogenase NADP-binding domain-containing protein [Bacteroidota bacterium]MDW8137668.1 saccharopine dehydrogenase C-terminal domain-containing protein [Bacteroidota bacterium]MDW8285378.1 saccharopine dehydrogenase C-terminal domain-containing protein [Bacteroidota bacteriu